MTTKGETKRRAAIKPRERNKEAFWRNHPVQLHIWRMRDRGMAGTRSILPEVIRKWDRTEDRITLIMANRTEDWISAI